MYQKEDGLVRMKLSVIRLNNVSLNVLQAHCSFKLFSVSLYSPLCQIRDHNLKTNEYKIKPFDKISNEEEM